MAPLRLWLCVSLCSCAGAAGLASGCSADSCPSTSELAPGRSQHSLLHVKSQIARTVAETSERVSAPAGEGEAVVHAAEVQKDAKSEDMLKKADVPPLVHRLLVDHAHRRMMPRSLLQSDLTSVVADPIQAAGPLVPGGLPSDDAVALRDSMLGIDGVLGGNVGWDSRLWLIVLSVPALLWVSTSTQTGPMTIISCYMIASISMNILNKEAASNFKATFLLVIVQMVFSDIIVLLMEFRKMKCGRWQDIFRWSIVPVAFAGMLATSMWAMREATLSAVLILKNLLPIISFMAEKALFDTPPSVTHSMILSLVVTFVGTVLYGYADVSVTSFGKLLIVINCMFTLLDRLVQTYYLKLSKDFTISIPLCMLLNNSLGVLPMLVLAGSSGEFPMWQPVVVSTTPITWFWVVMSAGCGACLGYVGLRTQQLVSGTTVLVLQNLNKVMLLFLSSVALGDQLRLVSWIGCSISIGGCFWYSALRLPVETKKMELQAEAQGKVGEPGTPSAESPSASAESGTAAETAHPRAEGAAEDTSSAK